MLIAEKKQGNQEKYGSKNSKNYGLIINCDCECSKKKGRNQRAHIGASDICVMCESHCICSVDVFDESVFYERTYITSLRWRNKYLHSIIERNVFFMLVFNSWLLSASLGGPLIRNESVNIELVRMQRFLEQRY